MNALAVEVEKVTSEAERRIPGRERSWIDAVFAEWGAWIWENRAYEGYPTAEHVTAFLSGAGGGIGGHRILCKDPPPWLRFAFGLWLMLSEGEKLAVWVEYVPGVGDDGHLWARAEKCRRLGITENAFDVRLHRARVRIWEWSRKRRI